MGRIFYNRWVQVFLLCSLLIGAVALRVADPRVVERLRYIAFDYYNKVMPRIAGDQVVIVDIDEESLQKLGQWPWPRTEIAKIPDILTDLGAKTVAFDMVFSEPDRTSPEFMLERLEGIGLSRDAKSALEKLPSNDAYFAKRIKENGKTVTAFVWTQQPTMRPPIRKATIFNTGFKPYPEKFVNSVRYFATNLPELSEASAGNGSFSMSPEHDGLIRRVPMVVGHIDENEDVTIHPALPLEAIRVALGKKLIKLRSFGEPTEEGFGINAINVGGYNVPTDSEGNIWVYYAGHRPQIYIPAWKVLAGIVSPTQVKDKIVMVGTSAIGLLDLRSTPLDPVIPGVEVHAEIIEQVLNNQFLQRPDFFKSAEIAFTVAISLLVIVLAPFIAPMTLALVVVFLMCAGGLASVYAYQALGFLVDPLYPALTITMIFILSSLLNNLRSEGERRMIKNAFGHYISKDLMDELTSDPDKLQLGGEVKELSVMFTDVRNFTTISEALTPAEIIQMMNGFLTPMTSIVMEERGTVDKYMGDAMMAFWNAPLDVKDHAKHACRAALKMAEALDPVNEVMKSKAEADGRVFHEIRTGIGLATGLCSIGNMGSKQRFAYSALGDTVNLSSRLEGQTKPYGVPIMTSSTTMEKAKDFAFLELDLLQVKGRTEPERVYALVGDEATAGTKAFLDLKNKHDEMIVAYRAKKFDKAKKLCVTLSKDNLAKDITGFYALMIERCVAYKTNPPPRGWAGVYIATDK